MTYLASFQKCRALIFFRLFVVLFIVGAASAQTPTQQQLDIYRNLGPDQQKAILDALGRSGTSVPRPGVIPDRTLEFPQTVQPRESEDEAKRDRERRFLKGGDTLLLYLEIRKFDSVDARAIQERLAAQALQAQQAQSPAGLNLALQGGQVVAPPTTAASRPGTASSSQPQEDRMPINRTAEQLAQLNELRDRIQRRNPFVLDEQGVLYLPETGPVPLGGLTVEEAQERLGVTEQLRGFVVTVLRLPVTPVGAAALKPFGYELFAGSPSTFAPATDVPVPADYVIGPGDTIQVQLFGNTKGNYALVVDRQGRIQVPDLGPIAVGGMRFDAMRSTIQRRVTAQMIGTQTSVSMGELRSIRVFVLGDVEQPGSYTVGGLSTMTNALLVSGGVKKVGSLRNIQLKRNGEVVTRLDLYDLLLKGDTRSDVRVLPGDVIFIPPIGQTVGIGGEVRRPAIYELNGEKTANDIIALAGGLTPKADAALSTIERIDDQRRLITVGVNLSEPNGLATVLRNSDVIRIPEIRPTLEQSVTLSGYVYRPGDYQYRPGMRLSDLLTSVDELKPNADQHYILVRRELPPDRRLAIFSADLAKALAVRGSAADIELAPRDRVYVFDLESGRDNVIEPLMRELRMQSSLDAPTSEVRVGGRVKVPGRYPLEPGMRISDLIRAGGSLDEAAYESSAELTRYAVIDGESRQTELISVDLKKIRSGDLSEDVLLRPFDYLVVKEVPLWRQQETVEIRGEVRFPGKYPIHRGETLRSVIERAGGLTESAFAKGAAFTRQDLKERERKQIDLLATRMQADITQLSLQAAQETGKDVGQALAVGQSMLTALRTTEPVGRLVIDLEAAMGSSPGSRADIVMKDGDLLVVPRLSQEVTVLGEVQSATSHFYNPKISRDDYIDMSGGVTQRADKRRIYVVKADGSVVARSSNAWFSRSYTHIDAGDTIVVPLDAERMRALPMWQSVTTIIYNLAIAAAAVHSF